LTVPLTDAAEPAGPDFLKVMAERFAEQHRTRYGHANLGAPIEFVTLRSTAFGDLGRPEPQKWPHAESPEFPHETRQVVFGGERHDTTVIRRDDLLAGHRLAGPAVILEDTATTVVPPGYQVAVDDIGSLIIRAKEQA
jgi:N-methylhydantoinase A